MTVVALRSDRAPADGDGFVVRWGLVGTTVVLLAVMGVSFAVLADELPTGEDTLTVEVVGHQYWWEVTYPGADGAGGEVVTANEIHVPVGEPVRFVLTTADVLHSVWVPSLGGKVDMVPGRTNELVLQADEAGLHEGYCTEFCGLQHARMKFHVVAEPREEFEAWLAAQAEPAQVGDARALAAFEENSCAACHAIRGTDAAGQLGPDLTHLASREFIAAGVLRNDEENLRAFVPAAQSFKHGALMPDLPQAVDDLDVLVELLQDLE